MKQAEVETQVTVPEQKPEQTTHEEHIAALVTAQIAKVKENDLMTRLPLASIDGRILTVFRGDADAIRTTHTRDSIQAVLDTLADHDLDISKGEVIIDKKATKERSRLTYFYLGESVILEKTDFYRRNPQAPDRTHLAVLHISPPPSSS